MGTTRRRILDLTGPTIATCVTHFDNGDPDQELIFPGYYSGESCTIDDVPHPGYANLAKSGALVLGDMQLVRTSRSFTPGDVTRTSQPGDGWRDNISGDLAAWADRLGNFDPMRWQETSSGTEGEALVDAYAKIRDDQILSGEIMASLGQSLSMLRRPFGESVKLLRRISRNAKRSYRKTSESVSKANAGAWLEARYGWLPLFMDFRTGFRLFSQGEKRLAAARKVARASVMGSESMTSEFTEATTGSPWGFLVSGSVERNVKWSSHGGVIYQISGRTGSQALAEDLRLGVDSLKQTAWELVPFSFVADWFVKVGPWLEANNLPPSVTVLGNWTTKTLSIEDSFSGTLMWSSFSDLGTCGTSITKYGMVTRSVNQELPPYPPVTIRLPGFLRAIDAISLSMNKINWFMGRLKH